MSIKQAKKDLAEFLESKGYTLKQIRKWLREETVDTKAEIV